MLSAAKLAKELLKLSDKPVRDVQEMGRRWALAYRSYAIDGRSPLQSPPTITEASVTLLGLGMAAAFRAKSPDAVANLMSQAVTAFWMLPPVAFVNAFPGAVTAVPGAVALPPALLLTWASNFATRATNASSAQALAAAFDVFTHSVIITHTTPVPTVGPLT